MLCKTKKRLAIRIQKGLTCIYDTCRMRPSTAPRTRSRCLTGPPGIHPSFDSAGLEHCTGAISSGRNKQHSGCLGVKKLLPSSSGAGNKLFGTDFHDVWRECPCPESFSKKLCAEKICAHVLAPISRSVTFSFLNARIALEEWSLRQMQAGPPVGRYAASTDSNPRMVQKNSRRP